MPKSAVGDWSSTAANNTDVGGISIAEGMSPASVNNAMRETMAQLATWYASNDWSGTGASITGNDLNNITLGGIYTFSVSTTNRPASASGSVIHVTRSTDQYFQIAGSTGLGRLFWREKSSGVWSDWFEFQTFPTDANGATTIDADGFYVGTDAALDPSVAEYGGTITVDGAAVIARNAGIPLIVKRSNDGSLVPFYVAQTQVGVISAAAGVVTYGSFCGAHWSQFHSFARPNILPGTILETIDEMCVWDGKPDDVLPRVKVAEPGAAAVYGVFSHWDMVDNADGTQTQSRDFFAASLGTHPIRLAPGVSPVKGMLIEAGPDGLGVPQADDVFRSSTVGKVLSAVRSKTYDDGSFLIPCTLHCG